MTQLSTERCSVCRPDSPPVSPDDLATMRALIPDWEVVEVDGKPRLRRTFRFASYRATLAFVQRVGEIADHEDHHPTMVVDWGKVRVSWWTHAIRNLTRNDFVMAAKTDEVFTVTRPGDEAS